MARAFESIQIPVRQCQTNLIKIKPKKSTPGDKPDPPSTVTSVHNTDTTANPTPSDQHTLELNHRTHIRAPPYLFIRTVENTRENHTPVTLSPSVFEITRKYFLLPVLLRSHLWTLVFPKLLIFDFL